MTSAPAFLPTIPLTTPRTTHLRHYKPLCCARQQPPLPSTGVKRALHRLRAPLLTAVTVLGTVFNFGGPFLPNAVAKELRYDGSQELDTREKAMSLTLTAGTFAALGVWAWRKNRKEDELEEIRIKEEVERLEKLKAEFMDVEQDEDTIDDEDLLASLRDRIADADRDNEEEGTDAEESSTGTSTAVKEDDSISDVDRLKRMWDADANSKSDTDADEDKDDDNKS